MMLYTFLEVLFHSSLSNHLLTPNSFVLTRLQIKQKKILVDHAHQHSTEYSPGEISPILSSPLVGENLLIHDFFSCVNNYIEDVATFTVLVKINLVKYLYNSKVTSIGEIFLLRNISTMYFV